MTSIQGFRLLFHAPTRFLNCNQLLEKLFSSCGMPEFVHYDNVPSCSSGSIKEFLLKRGVASSKSIPYHSTGNSQAERYISIVRKSIRLSLKPNNLPLSCWETVLPDALHFVRSLLNTTINATPHELSSNFNRRPRSGRSLPIWLPTPGPVMLQKFLQNHKNNDLVEEVQLLNANHQYANICYRDSRESNISLNDLSPCPQWLKLSEIESRFPILYEEDPQTSPVQQGRMIYCTLLFRNLSCRIKMVMLPFLNTKIRCNRTTTTLFISPVPNQPCLGWLGQLRVFHPFDMESQFLVKRERLLYN